MPMALRKATEGTAAGRPVSVDGDVADRMTDDGEAGIAGSFGRDCEERVGSAIAPCGRQLPAASGARQSSQPSRWSRPMPYLRVTIAMAWPTWAAMA